MINTIQQLKEERPDLVELFESLNKERLLKQCYLEAIDAINLENQLKTYRRREEIQAKIDKKYKEINKLYEKL